MGHCQPRSILFADATLVAVSGADGTVSKLDRRAQYWSALNAAPWERTAPCHPSPT